MPRHVYQPPRGKFTGLFAIIGGLLATIGVFLAIPLSQKLAAVHDLNQAAAQELTIEPPEEEVFEMDEPPEELEEEPEPEELVEEPTEMDLGIDLSDLAMGTGGGFLMEIPSFAMKGGDDLLGGDLDSPPIPIRKLPPTYPSSLLSKGIGGRVLITCEIDAGGRIASTSIKQSSGHPELDQAALSAVSRWQFKSGTQGGKNVRATCLIPFNFEVKKD